MGCFCPALHDGVCFLLDELVVLANDPAQDDKNFPTATLLTVILAISHFALMILAIIALTGGTGLPAWNRVVLFFAFGLFFGQVSNSNGHELIHQTSPRLRSLGHWVFISHLFGHHASAHPKVHHRFVGSVSDPNSAPLGMSFYRFAPRAWIGSFKQGFRVETKQWQVHPGGWWTHPYVAHITGALACISMAFLLGGQWGIVVYVALAAYATTQLLMSDYVQHYGLRRLAKTDGQLEPVTARHSWNAPHWFSNFLMLAAPRHSDHHSHPGKHYPNLQIEESSPTLPRSLPTMGFIALTPKRWRRIMDPLAKRWENLPVDIDLR